MKTLVTPSEVIAIAFGATNTLEESAVPQHAILAAQECFLLPVLGEELHNSLSQSQVEPTLATFAEEYLKEPLALFVAARLLPTLAVKVGTAGVVRLAGSSFESVEPQTLHRASLRLAADANTLLDRATRYLEEHPELFEGYNPHNNIRQRASLKGGVFVEV